MFTYGAEILPFHDHDFESSIRTLADMGFADVNLWSSAAPLAHHISPGDDVGSIRTILDRYGVRPTGLTVYGKNPLRFRSMRQFIPMAPRQFAIGLSRQF